MTQCQGQQLPCSAIITVRYAVKFPDLDREVFVYLAL